MAEQGTRKGAWWKQTRAEQRSYRDTLNLFFGALLGANLCTLGGLAVEDYVRIIASLLGLIMVVQSISAARSRTYALAMLAGFGALIAFGYFTGALRPAGLAAGDFAKIAATIAMWLVATAIVEATPVIDRDGP